MTMPPLAVLSAICWIESETDVGEVLLGARQDAGLRGRVRLVLVDVDADGVDARRAGGVDDAVAGQAGDLEDDVDARVLLDELLTVGGATGLVGEALDEVDCGDPRGLHLDGRVDRLGAQVVALDVANARAADRDATDRADDAALAGRGRHDAGEVAGLVFLVVDRDVVRDQRGEVTRAVREVGSRCRPSRRCRGCGRRR